MQPAAIAATVATVLLVVVGGISVKVVNVSY